MPTTCHHFSQVLPFAVLKSLAERKMSAVVKFLTSDHFRAHLRVHFRDLFVRFRQGHACRLLQNACKKASCSSLMCRALLNKSWLSCRDVALSFFANIHLITFEISIS
jgi:hypothetical protein